MSAKRLLLVLGVLVGGVLFFPEGERNQAEGILVATEPAQRPVTQAPFEFDGHRIEALAEFEIEARVLGKERYWLDHESRLAKYDLALGWGPMSDSRVLDQIEIRQSGRWYRWRSEQLPIPRREIERSSANMHLIPADDWLEGQIGDVKTGDLVRIKGYLVRVTNSDGWRWQSSLTRDDTGRGACELIYVESFEII